MKIKLTRKREIYGRLYPKGGVADVPTAFGERLIYIGDAKPTKAKETGPTGTPLPRGIPKRELLKKHGFDTEEKALDGDLTTIKGIGDATEKYIKDSIG